MEKSVSKILSMLDRRSWLESEIKKNSPKVYDLSQQVIYKSNAASHDEDRLRRFGPYSGLSISERPSYDKVKREADRKRQLAIEAKMAHQEAKENLDQMQQELEGLILPPAGEKFKISDTGNLLKKRAASWITAINEVDDLIEKLEAKRENLKEDIARTNINPDRLNDEKLIKTDVEKHHASLTAQKDSSDRVSTIQDLIQQLDQTLEEKYAYIEKLRADFTTVLHEFAGQYRKMASKEIAKKFNAIFTTDSLYADAVNSACSELIQQANLNPKAVFKRDFLGVTKSMTSPLQTEDDLKKNLEKFIRSASSSDAN